MALTPNATFQMNGVTVKEKIIPDGTRWKDAVKAKAAGFAANDLYKKQQKLSGGTGKVQWVTIHNTGDLVGVDDDAEQYTRATYNENMGSTRVHYYVDDNGAWQNLKAGTGLCANDPEGSAEVSWHSGDGSVADGGNMTSLSIEIIMNESAAHDEKAKDNGARIAAWLLKKHGLTVDKLVTHTYWVNKAAGKSFSDVDKQCTNLISGKKWCPAYIFASTNVDAALKNWKGFKEIVKNYMDKLSGGSASVPAAADSNVVYRSLGIAAKRKKADVSGDLVSRCERGGYYAASQVVTPAVGTQKWLRHAGTDLYSALTDTPAAGNAKLFEEYGAYTVGKTTDCVNVRAEAGTDKKIITALPKGTEVYLTGKTVQASDMTWTQVVYDGVLAWMAKQYITC